MASTNLEEQFRNLGIENRVFQDLEREFQAVIQDLSGDASMENFKREFEKLHKALKRSHERETEYLKKCKELNDTILNDTAGVETAIKFTQENDNRIKKLQRQLEDVKNTLKQQKEREKRNQEKIQSLKNAMKNMDESLKNTQSMSTGRANLINDWISKKEEMTVKLENLKEIKTMLSEETSELDGIVSQQKQANTEDQQYLDSLKVEIGEIEIRVKKEENRQEQQTQLAEITKKKSNMKEEKKNDIEEKKKLKSMIGQFVSTPSPFLLFYPKN